MNVLFIVDGSLSNPILHSQGIPHILENSKRGINYFVLSFESSTEDSQYNKWYVEAKKKLEGKTEIFSVKHKNSITNSKFIAFSFLILGIIKVFKIVKKYKINIIHCRSNKPTLIGLCIKLLLNVKVLYDNRGIVSDEIESSKKIRVKIESILEKFLLKYSNAIVVVSKAFENYLLSQFGTFLNTKELFVIRNCFSEDRFVYSNDLRKQLINLYGLSDRFIMVYSGPAIGWQRFDLILKIFKCLKQIKQNAFFLIISYDLEIENAIKSSSIAKEDYKIFNLPASEVNKHLMLGDFGVILSDYKLRRIVSAPIKFGEYLASGLPILMMNKIGDTEEIITKYNIGIIAMNEDQLLGEALIKIIKLTNVPGIKEKCRSVAEKELSLSYAANQYYEIYKSLISQNN